MQLPAPLTDRWFEAYFYSRVSESGHWHEHEEGRPFSFAESQGLMLWCPCGYGLEQFPLDGGRPHAIMVPFANPPNGVPLPANHGPVSRDSNRHPRWTVSGSGLHDLTITPSIAVGNNPECWHGHIINGVVQ